MVRIFVVIICLAIVIGIIWFIRQPGAAIQLSQVTSNQSPLPKLDPNIEKKFENADFDYTFNYPEVYAVKTASESGTTSIQYCPNMQLAECDFQTNTITIQEFSNPNGMVVDTWITESPDSPLVKEGWCWINKAPQDAGKTQGFEFRSYQFKVDEKLLSDDCVNTELSVRDNVFYKFVKYGDKVVFIKIANASDSQFPMLQKIAQSITFLPLANTSTAWNPVCQSLNMATVSSPVFRDNEGTTYLARRAINDYFNAVTLSSLNSQVPRLNEQESIYAEDYIRKHVNLGTVTEGQKVDIPCTVVEEATLKARLLTVGQKENLSKYNVGEREIDDLINNELEKLFQNTSPELREHSGVIKLN